MTENIIDPVDGLTERLASMDRQELCRLVIGLCGAIAEKDGDKTYHGGVFPDNIRFKDDGEPEIGPGRRSGWEGQELQFVPPELYWNAETRPEGDVYALGLLLYYGVTGGRLPLEGESPNPQLSRMSGAAFSAPAAAGVRLGEIIEKATSFRAEDRYPNAGELAVNLESCLENKYVSEHAGEELFRKEEENLSDVEKMMLDIIAGVPSETPEEQVPAAAGETIVYPISEEEAAAMILGFRPPEREERDEEAERRELVEEVFGSSGPESGPETGEVSAPAPEPEQDAEDEPEDVRVYEPSHEKKDHIPIPILTEEMNPELEPVIPKRRPVPFQNDPVRSQQIRKTVRTRLTRTLGVVLILCGLLIIAALVANHWLQNYRFDDEGQGREISMPEVGEDAISAGDGFVTADELVRQEETASHQTYYQIFSGDVSWTDAKNACSELGGRLAVINTQDEFIMVSQLAQQTGVQGVWVGCHRENGFLLWETQEPVGTMTWADREPSYVDSRDGAAEDYVMLWNTGNGWAYIDCRNDPVRGDPAIYHGVIGYVCEFENN